MGRTKDGTRFFKIILFNLQLLDLPGIIEGAKDGKGRGRQVKDLTFFHFTIVAYFV